MLILAMIFKVIGDQELVVAISMFLGGIVIVYLLKFFFMIILYFGNGYFRLQQERHIKQHAEKGYNPLALAAGLIDLRSVIGIEPSYEIKFSDVASAFAGVTVYTAIFLIFISMASKYAELGYLYLY